MGRWVGSAIVVVTAVAGCRDVEETPYEPASTTSSGESSGETTESSSTSTSPSETSETGGPPDVDSATTSSSTAADSTGGDDDAHETVCGEGFALDDASSSALLEIDDRRVVERVEITVRAEHSEFASVEIAIAKDDTRRVLLAPGSVDCSGELSVYFSDFGRLHAEDACFTDEPDARVLPAESLDVFANAPVAGAWALEATGDPAALAAITAWCLVLRFAE